MDRIKRLLDIYKAYEDFMGSFSTVFEYRVLLHIGLNEFNETPLTVKQLVLLNLGPKTSLERVIRKMVKDGIVIRKESGNDRRVHLLYLNQATKQRLFKLYDDLEMIVKARA